MKPGIDMDWGSLFTEAALDPAKWLAALQCLAEATGSSRAELVGFGDAPAVRFNWLTSVEPRFLDEFISIEGHRADLNYRIAADAGTEVLEIVHEAHYDRARRSLRRDDVVDFFEQYHMPLGCQTALLRDSGALVGMSLLRSRADGRTTEAERGIFAEAARSARTAVRMQRAIEQQGFHLLAGTLEAMSLACFLTDGLGRVQAMTPAAERKIGEQPLLRLADSRIGSPDRGADRRIERALRSVLNGAGVAHERVPLYRDDPMPEIVLDIFRLPRREWAMHFAPRAMVVARDPRSAAGGGATLAAACGLTPAEAQVALAIAQGQSRETVAAERGVSPETLRAQLKSIYQKTGCSREAELVLLIKAIVG